MGCRILPYRISGEVVKGFGRGSSSLGIPTANLAEEIVEGLPEELVTGVYYGWAALNKRVYKMVASIGWNPFYKNEKKSLEAHLLHKFSNDFYGERLKIILTGYIRPERDFKSVDELIKEIKNDIAITEQKLDDSAMAKFKDDVFLIEDSV